MKLNIEQIREILPHRYPFLLIDCVEDCQPGIYARALKCVTANEPFFQGHFPEYMVMPGVLIIEALAQAGGIALLTEPQNKNKLALLGGIKNARFRAQVVPGDVLTLECTLTRKFGNIGFATAEATVSGKKVCTAEISFAILASKD